jgi:hypothetical protein
MTAKNEFAALVGLDWADRKHDVCVQTVADGRREFAVLGQRPEAINAWANALRARFDNRAVAVCVELRRGPVIHALSKYEHLVLFMVNPGLVAKMRRALRPSGAEHVNPFPTLTGVIASSIWCVLATGRRTGLGR